MDTSNPITKKDGLTLLIIILASTILYLYNINLSDIWVDEVFTRELTTKSLPGLIEALIGDFHPPLYFLGLKLFTAIVGLSDFSIRLFSVIGAVLTLVLSYVVGRKIFGNRGALYLSILLLALPMLASNAQIARMYTWSLFFTTGVFLYACLFIQSERRKDLVILGAFSLLAMYTHYYCLIAAFWANVFVLLHFLLNKRSLWKQQLVMGVIITALFIPWLFVLFRHIGAANKEFWIEPASIVTFFQCYAFPFAQKYALTPISYALILLVYSSVILAVFMAYKKLKKGNILRTAFGLSMVVFNATILSALVISLFSQSVLYYRYIITMASLLFVPVVILLLLIQKSWIRYGVLSLIIILSLYISLKATYFSYGPYKQAITQFEKTHPEIDKIIYQSEVSLVPMLYYSEDKQLQHYWLDNEHAVYYTNLKAFDKLNIIHSMDEMVQPGDSFCFASIYYIPLNPENAELIRSQSELLEADTIIDIKDPYYMRIILQYLKYKGEEALSEK